MKKIKLIEIRSELGAGTRGAAMGIDALKVACLNMQSPFFRRFNAEQVPDMNHVLFHPNQFPYAKYIDSILTVHKNIVAVMNQTLEMDMFPLILAGDHSNTAATVAGIKQFWPDKTLGLIWIDAHSDCHSPYTTPSGNVHGMAVAQMLAEDNADCHVNDPDPDTIFYWNALKRVGGPQPKIRPEHLVYILVRDTEYCEDELIAKKNIKKVSYREFNEKGAGAVAQEALDHLTACDLIYVSFDVDSLDPKFSRGTGTPVETGLTVEQAQDLCAYLLRHDKVCAFDMVEINPTLDSENTMAQNAFTILESAIGALFEREHIAN